jgi:hypothetical protein
MASPPLKTVPHKTNLELFAPVALAYLMDGRNPQTALDGHVPLSVPKHVRSAGMIKRKMLLRGVGEGVVTWPTKRNHRSKASVKMSPGCDHPCISMECRKT